jgi:hypothetical protein
MKRIGMGFVALMLAGLGGCMAVPVAPGYYEGAPGYYAPAPVYYGPSVYFGPSIGIYGGGRGRGRGYRRR